MTIMMMGKVIRRIERRTRVIKRVRVNVRKDNKNGDREKDKDEMWRRSRIL